MKKAAHSINIWDFVTCVLQLCTAYQMSSKKSNFTLLAWFSPKLDYQKSVIYS